MSMTVDAATAGAVSSVKITCPNRHRGRVQERVPRAFHAHPVPIQQRNVLL
jgi:hypothetical protein